MLSASTGRDSCQRISADSSTANSVNFPNKADCAAIIFKGGRRQKNGVINMKLPWFGRFGEQALPHEMKLALSALGQR